MERPGFYVAEVDGPDGPVCVSERLIQRIWQTGNFAQNGLRTVDGREIRIRHPGRWNQHEGPDFLDAHLTIGAWKGRGDVELHLYEEDWQHHGHAEDPNFRNVILHVVLFPVSRDSAVPIPRLCLLPYLYHDLANYADEEALLQLEQRSASVLAEPWLSISLAERRKVFQNAAADRWRQKVAAAGELLREVTWEEALHRRTLEVLGFRRNRAAMRQLAERFSPAEMLRLGADALIAEAEWKQAGLRPANQPRTRLEQYLRLHGESPAWPERLRIWADSLVAEKNAASTREIRRKGRFSAQRENLQKATAQAIGGSRLDTWVVDAILPLAAANGSKLWPAWYHWFAGDHPDALRNFLKFTALIDREHPLGNGLIQGGLGLLSQQQLDTFYAGL